MNWSYFKGTRLLFPLSLPFLVVSRGRARAIILSLLEKISPESARAHVGGGGKEEGETKTEFDVDCGGFGWVNMRIRF